MNQSMRSRIQFLFDLVILGLIAGLLWQARINRTQQGSPCGCTPEVGTCETPCTGCCPKKGCGDSPTAR